jgi:hypothetical protein
MRVRVGPERTRTPGTQFYRTSLCHCPNVASAGASRRRKSSLRRCEPSQHLALYRPLILRSNITEPCNDIVEKRQFPGAKGAPSSCPVGSIAVAGLRRCGGPREPNGVAATAWRHGGDIDWSIGNVRLVRYIIWTPSQYVIGAPEEISNS